MKQACWDIRLLSILWETVAACVCVGVTKHKLFSGSLRSLTTLPLNTKQKNQRNKIDSCFQSSHSRTDDAVQNLFALLFICLVRILTTDWRLGKDFIQVCFLVEVNPHKQVYVSKEHNIKSMKINRKCYLRTYRHLTLPQTYLCLFLSTKITLSTLGTRHHWGARKKKIH